MSKSTLTLTDLWRKTATDVMTALQVSLSKPSLPPSEWEEPFWANNRVTIPIGGEGSGKSWMAGLFGTVHSVYDQVWAAQGFKYDGLYWVVGYDFEDARKDLSYVVEFQRKLDNVDEASSSFPTPREKQWVLRLKTKQRFETVSSYDYDKLGREEPDGVIGAEIGRWYPEIGRASCRERV